MAACATANSMVVEALTLAAEEHAETRVLLVKGFGGVGGVLTSIGWDAVFFIIIKKQSCHN